MSLEENKAIVRKIEEAWNSGSLEGLDALFGPDFKAHSAVPGMPAGLQSAKMAHQSSLQAFPDRRTTVEEMVAEGDTVVVRVHMTGTNQGGLPWLGVPANGKKIDTQWISIYRLAGGKVVEHRAIQDLMGMARQLGALPGPGAS